MIKVRSLRCHHEFELKINL